jgi:hypothetical protein
VVYRVTAVQWEFYHKEQCNEWLLELLDRAHIVTRTASDTTFAPVEIVGTYIVNTQIATTYTALEPRTSHVDCIVCCSVLCVLLDLVFALYSVFHSYFHAQRHSQRFTVTRIYEMRRTHRPGKGMTRGKD